MKYKNIYRNESIRLYGCNYAGNADYFITICTQNHDHYFGEIRAGVMHLSEIGKIAQMEWFKSPELRPDMNIELGEFVVMPNHIHGIITIGQNEFNQFYDNDGRFAMYCKPTHTTKLPYKNKLGPQCKNLAAIIRGYKSAVTNHARRIDPDYAWQALYYDHIIHNPESARRIRLYIQNNVQDWSKDWPNQ